ncbi:RES family NAD+ phosphorylase [Rhodoligotrophos defluvii]|uniref:RES family NAD+ phosphorylase n=1 Tax=Rhodoligotrophos defluvii TaxID=2561934 RepID=UPI0010C96C4F|nr:RES family NAD+ phosphorylase [Rhodoligotrophos defluvii]
MTGAVRVAPLRTAKVAARMHRLIASRYPTVGVFDDIAASEEDLRAAFALEALTNDRMTTLTQRLTLFEPGDIVSGPTASLVMAAFLHADDKGGRFTDGRLGAWYASLEVETAVAETVYHSERRLRLSEGGFPNAIEMRELVSRVDAKLVDLRGRMQERPELYHPTDYSAAQAFGVALRWPIRQQMKDRPMSAREIAQERAGRNGIVYDSVRREAGTCLCLYKPALVQLPVLQGDHYRYSWSASGRLTVARISTVEAPVAG